MAGTGFSLLMCRSIGFRVRAIRGVVAYHECDRCTASICVVVCFGGEEAKMLSKVGGEGVEKKYIWGTVKCVRSVICSYS